MKIELGCGLIGIGRKWGYAEKPLASEEEAMSFLQSAYMSGIRFFDTAPAYGSSEERLGKFISSLTPSEREKITIATKFGEHWNTTTQEAYTDHSYEALTGSLDQSLVRLNGRIDLLQVHKTNPQVLKSKDLTRAIEYAQEQGIKRFGASVSDVETANAVVESGIFSSMQFPFNTENTKFKDVIDKAVAKSILLIINRPYNMGSLMYRVDQESNENARKSAYLFIAENVPMGIVLTGTASPSHLKENIEAFQLAVQNPHLI